MRPRRLRLWITTALAGAVTVAAAIAVLPAVQVNAEPGNCPATAADTHGWGVPNRADHFAGSAVSDAWYVYDGPGHAGNGRRTPAAISVSDSVLTITGDPAGNSAGMAWKQGQMYGRWEVCARSAPGSPNFHPVLLLWPDAEDWPVGGELDFMEVWDPHRQQVDVALHYGPDDSRTIGVVDLDATQWHSWAVEWTPDRITTFVDGREWWHSTDSATFPPRPMHLCIQLDNFGGDVSQGGSLQVDWAQRYGI
ncbi:glycoside hydrolase family 16 protein [Mycolicibacterium mengxianglii]|uniref:glycoside hydrolase family 16 protein n=1 Tax=Mycolicibacterium mengxianglii TaxID=2736649 RepID=UPI0027D9EA3F|nr:glycoside hydrolase family 16 protein [Mycolicibacterium mengxianglii]